LGKLFGTDGIRGEANRYPMDVVMAISVGQALVHLLKGKPPQPQVVIGRDTRISGPMLESALAAGITSMGGEPFLTGVLPTPGIAHYTRISRFNAGIVISASHNPYQDNGIKVFSGEGFKLSDQQEDFIEDMVLGGDLPKLVPPPYGIGKSHNADDAEDSYVDFISQCFPAGYTSDSIKIVIDTANGATYRVAPRVFERLGLTTTVIHDKPDGLNINDRCGSQYTKNLQERVVELGADLGLAFDGDGDRLIAVDEKGQRLTGDQILIICANVLKREGRLKNNLLVTTVMSNLGLSVACRRYGFVHHASKVGDRFVLEDMKRLGGVLGGEESGHIIFLDHHTTGDGLLAAMQLIATVIKEGKPLSELSSLMEIYPQKLINVSVKSKPEISSVALVTEAIRQVEKELGEDGRVLVRYSGTETLCRVMVEGPTPDLTEKYCNQIADAVKTAIG
jgi:phosphoglucosamine mutase